MYAGMTNEERAKLEEEIKARRAAKAAGTLARIPQAKPPHDEGATRPAGWTAPNYCRTGQNPKDFAPAKKAN